MKFTTLALTGLAAISRVQAAPQDNNNDNDNIFDKVDTFVNDVQTRWDAGGSFVNDIKTKWEAAISTGNPQAILSSLSSVAATATGEALAEITQAMAQASNFIDDITDGDDDDDDDNNNNSNGNNGNNGNAGNNGGNSGNNAGNNGANDDKSAGALHSVAYAMAGVLGGVALFANL